MHIQPLRKHTCALAFRAIIDDILDLPSDRRHKSKVCEREEQSGQIPAISASPAQYVASCREIRNRSASRESVEQEDDPQRSGQELVPIAGQDGVALVAVRGVLEVAEEDVLVDGEPEGAGAGDEGRHDEELVRVVEKSGCHGVD